MRDSSTPRATAQRAVLPRVSVTLRGSAALRISAALLAASLTAACGDAAVAPADPLGTSGQPLTAAQTYISEYIQIDRVGAGPGDANLRLDQAGSAQQDGVTYLDWDELVTVSDGSGGRVADPQALSRHVLRDDSPDDTAFPRSASCIAEGNVLDKMDLTFAAAASNSRYAFFAVQRAANNGDAAYYWLFTRLEPTVAPDPDVCQAGERRLSYDLEPGDVLLVGHFAPSGGPLLTLYQARTAAADLPAEQAIDFSNGALWGEAAGHDIVSAVNTSWTEAGALGVQGLKHTMVDGSTFAPELFAEAAVELTVFDSGPQCGDKRYWVSVVSLPSQSRTSDLKDLIGPQFVDFGTATAELTATPSCDGTVAYVARATDPTGAGVSSPACEWTLEDGSRLRDAAGQPVTACAVTLPNAQTSLAVKQVSVTDPVSGCGEDIGVSGVTAYPPLGASCTLTGGCASGFSYRPRVSGGLAPSCSWDFEQAVDASTVSLASGVRDAACAGGTSADHAWPLDLDNTVTGRLSVTDTLDTRWRCRAQVCTDAGCTASCRSETFSGVTCRVDPAPTCSDEVFAPLRVHLVPLPERRTCDAWGDTITFAARASGGDADSRVLTWSDPGCTGPTCAQSAGTDRCADRTLSVTVSDRSGCPPATSETESWSIRTVITATDCCRGDEAGGCDPTCGR